MSHLCPLASVLTTGSTVWSNRSRPILNDPIRPARSPALLREAAGEPLHPSARGQDPHRRSHRAPTRTRGVLRRSRTTQQVRLGSRDQPLAPRDRGTYDWGPRETHCRARFLARAAQSAAESQGRARVGVYDGCEEASGVQAVDHGAERDQAGLLLVSRS